MYKTKYVSRYIEETHERGKKVINDSRPRPVSLLPICVKIFERLVSNSLLEYFEKQKLLSACQSGFRPNNSCVDQVLSSFHDIYIVFLFAYLSLESQRVFFGYVWTFDEV